MYVCLWLQLQLPLSPYSSPEFKKTSVRLSNLAANVSRSHAFRKSKEISNRQMEVDKDMKGKQHRKRVPLKVVVDHCVRRWFEEYLTAAKAGDREMQLLVGQMFNSGYGVERDPVKGKFWLEKAGKRQQDASLSVATSSEQTERSSCKKT